MTNKHIEYIGWLGFILIIAAYLSITLQFLDTHTPIYHTLNLIGALCMVINAKYKNSKPLLCLNAVWALIALFGLFK